MKIQTTAKYSVDRRMPSWNRIANSDVAPEGPENSGGGSPTIVDTATTMNVTVTGIAANRYNGSARMLKTLFRTSSRRIPWIWRHHKDFTLRPPG